MVVVDEEPEERAGERGQHQRLVRLMIEHEVDAEKQGGDGRDAGGQAVHVVEHVHGVRDADQPEERDQHVDGEVRRPRQHQSERDDRAGGEQLADQFLIRPGVQEVIRQAEEEERAAGRGDDHVVARQRHEEDEHRDGGDGDGHAAEHRRRLRVPAVALRLRHRADAAGERGDGRSQRQRRDECREGGFDERSHA